ncbi:hypothetical protein COU55_03235 [Candidatus Pacearchaeota archaeon CG10_big_fil_rev_8_21_14_0_10_31_59]|nr:MAG: hypothetical protein COU55_03235 [Candidatus Pacearchaeota archaeon CG10_big_fil_rev_8_21_14_0_10_31_59]
MGEKGFLQFSFAWLFAIVVGAFILFLAIFFVSKLIGQGQAETDAKTGKEIGILLNPLETGFESAKTLSLTMPVETRIYNKCDNHTGNFGKQLIQISQKSFNRWTETDIDISFINKYLFSEGYVEGKKFNIFSKPFEFPFKVSDLIYITPSSKNYCFVGAPTEIEEEITSLGQQNLFIKNCPEESVKICFGGANSCDIKVDYEGGFVQKNSKKLYFYGKALMYAAIFSDSETYECQLKRLMQRTEQLAILYDDKANFVSRYGCDSNLGLLQLSNSADSFKDSGGLNLIFSEVEQIKMQHDGASCKLW